MIINKPSLPPIKGHTEERGYKEINSEQSLSFDTIFSILTNSYQEGVNEAE